MTPVVKELARRVISQSPLGNYQPPMSVIRHCVSVEPLAKALCAIPAFLPDLKKYTGRAVQLPGSSWLGPFFSVSIMPDQLIIAQPDIRTQYFSNMQVRCCTPRGSRSFALFE